MAYEQELMEDLAYCIAEAAWVGGKGDREQLHTDKNKEYTVANQAQVLPRELKDEVGVADENRWLVAGALNQGIERRSGQEPLHIMTSGSLKKYATVDDIARWIVWTKQ